MSVRSNIVKKLDFFEGNSIVFITIIGIVAFFVRLYYFPYGIPVVLDGLSYFSYATDVSILGHLPAGHTMPNNGWPVFLSSFFSILHFNNFLDYMMLQRFLSLSISVLTIIPVYLLCRRFFDRPYAIIGVTLFAFDPRIIQNSLLGISEPLYILLTTSALYLVLSKDQRSIYASFALAALSTLVRYEGALVLVILTIVFFSHKKEKNAVYRYIIAVTIFILVLLPMSYLRLQSTGQDGISSHLIAGARADFLLTENENNQAFAMFQLVVMGLESLVKYLGWVMIPIFILFTPLGYLLMLKQKQSRLFITLTMIILFIPALYAYSRGYQETRYLYVAYPIFCILALFTIQRFVEIFRNKKVIAMLLIGGILLSSIVFLDIKKIDDQHEREAFLIAQIVSRTAKAVNDYQPEDIYLISASLPDKWPELKVNIIQKTQVISSSQYHTLLDYIKASKGKNLTHLVIDGHHGRSQFLNDVFNHEMNYPYLIKVFDSSEYGYTYHVKIFKIDYAKLSIV